MKLGAVCVLDDKPREIDGCVKNCLLLLAKIVGDIVEVNTRETIRMKWRIPQSNPKDQNLTTMSGPSPLIQILLPRMVLQIKGSNQGMCYGLFQ